MQALKKLPEAGTGLLYLHTRPPFMALLNYNGTLYPDNQVLFDIRNPAFRQGLALIETLYATPGNIRLYHLHLQRLRSSLSQAGFPGMESLDLAAEIGKTFAANALTGAAMVRAQFFPGTGASLHFTIECLPLPVNGGAIRIGVASRATRSADSLSALKTSARMPYAIAAQEAQVRGWDDALLLNAAGRIAESTICNLFMLKEKKMYTPSLNEGCVAGVMRAWLLQQGANSGLQLEEAHISLSDLYEADALFLTNAVRGIIPVKSLETHTYNPSITQTVTAQLSVLL